MTRLAVRRFIACIAIAVVVALCAAGIEQMLWGRLYFASPIVVGFDRYELSHAIVYVEHGNPLQDFAWVDDWIEPTERFFQLRFVRKPAVYFFGSDVTYARRAGVRAGGVTAPNGVIAIAPWVQKPDDHGNIWVQTYVRHELSHSIVAQNRAWLAMRRQPAWLAEGLAAYVTDQRGTAKYPSQSETIALIAKGNWVSPKTYGTKAAKDSAPDVTNRVLFAYSEFACIVEDLDTRFGHEALVRFVHAMESSTDHDAVFAGVFGTDFDAYLSEFRNRVRASVP